MLKRKLSKGSLLAALSVFLWACGGEAPKAPNVVHVSYEGEGFITEGDNINCGNKCEARYTDYSNTSENNSIELLAVPAPGYEFYGWENCGNEPTCTTYLGPECRVIDDSLTIVCDPFKTVHTYKHAIFVPEGSIVDADWYYNQSCLINTSGEFRCWTERDTYPAENLVNPVDVEIHGWGGCVKDDSGLHCWGNPTRNMPVLNNPVDFVVEGRFTCAIDGGEVKCWIGSGLLPDITDQIPSVTNPMELWSDHNTVCVQDDNGTQCWGADEQIDTIQ